METIKEELVIIGSGCAGWTAAIYAARADLKPLVITGLDLGGQIATTTLVENFPGFPEGILGPQLTENMKIQAEKFGTRILEDNVNKFSVIDNEAHGEVKEFEIETSSKKIIAKAVIIATGATARWLGIPSEGKFRSRGVHTCATCDGFFYKDKDIIIIGGGDSAMEDATFLSKYTKSVTLIHRRHEFRASKIMQDKVFANPKIKIIWDSTIDEFKGEKKVQSVVIKNLVDGNTTEMKIDGVFLALGHRPNTDIFKDIIELDEEKFIVATNAKTNVSGIFACGDVQDRRYKQAITAAGSGCMAALEAQRYLEGK